MTSFRLEIITQERKVLDDMVESVYLTTIDGDITILAHHTPYVSILKPSEILIKRDGKEEAFAGTGGIIEVGSDKVIILADAVVREDEIDEEKAREAKEHAEKLMKEKLSDRENAETAVILERSLLHLKVAQKRRHHKNNMIR